MIAQSESIKAGVSGVHSQQSFNVHRTYRREEALQSQFAPHVHAQLTAATSVFASLVGKEQKGEQLTTQDVASGVAEGKAVYAIIDGNLATSQAQFESVLAALPQDHATKLQDLVDKSGGFVPFAQAVLDKVTASPPQAAQHGVQIDPDMFSVRFYTCALMVGAILGGQEEFIIAYIDLCSGDWVN